MTVYRRRQEWVGKWGVENDRLPGSERFRVERPTISRQPGLHHSRPSDISIASLKATVAIGCTTTIASVCARRRQGSPTTEMIHHVSAGGGHAGLRTLGGASPLSEDIGPMKSGETKDEQSSDTPSFRDRSGHQARGEIADRSCRPSASANRAVLSADPPSSDDVGPTICDTPHSGHRGVWR